jgi:NAD(P)-dependent dehydrogenase (short-subunit alcohol dehydrogenase family)
LAPHNIQANSIVVGAIGTEMTPPERQTMLVTAIPAGRIGTVEEIARLVVFLSSNACDYMTGANIVVDGGLTTLGFCASRPDL